MIKPNHLTPYNFGHFINAFHGRLLDDFADRTGLPKDEAYTTGIGITQLDMPAKGYPGSIAGSDRIGVYELGMPTDLMNNLGHARDTMGLFRITSRWMQLHLWQDGSPYVREADDVHGICSSRSDYYVMTTPDQPPFIVHSGFVVDEDDQPQLPDQEALLEQYGPDCLHTLTPEECQAIGTVLMQPEVGIAPDYEHDMVYAIKLNLQAIQQESQANKPSL